MPARQINKCVSQQHKVIISIDTFRTILNKKCLQISTLFETVEHLYIFWVLFLRFLLHFKIDQALLERDTQSKVALRALLKRFSLR